MMRKTYMKLNNFFCLTVGHYEPFSDEGGSHCWFGKFIEFIVCESGQNTTFSNTTVTDSDSFDL
jgi:hypothetical protein